MSKIVLKEEAVNFHYEINFIENVREREADGIVRVKVELLMELIHL